MDERIVHATDSFIDDIIVNEDIVSSLEVFHHLTRHRNLWTRACLESADNLQVCVLTARQWHRREKPSYNQMHGGTVGSRSSGSILPVQLDVRSRLEHGAQLLVTSAGQVEVNGVHRIFITALYSGTEPVRTLTQTASNISWRFPTTPGLLLALLALVLHCFMTHRIFDSVPFPCIRFLYFTSTDFFILGHVV